MASGTQPVGAQGLHYGDTSVVTDVTDFIFQITPTDKPFFHLIDDKPASVMAPYHQWQYRALSVRNPNVNHEGFVYTFTSTSRLPTRVANVLQILTKDIRISNTNQAIGHYAIPNMRADQVETQLAELGTDIEHALLRATMATGASGTARSMAGIMPVIVSAGSLYTTASGTSLTESRFNAFLEDGYNAGAALKDVLVDPRMKRTISNFTANTQRIINMDEHRVAGSLDVYDSEYGPVNTHISRDIPNFFGGTSLARGLLFIDKSQCAKAWLRTVGVKRTADIADSEDYIATCELTLEYGHPLGHLYVSHIGSGLVGLP
jgi:hypothetical protein